LAIGAKNMRRKAVVAFALTGLLALTGLSAMTQRQIKETTANVTTETTEVKIGDTASYDSLPNEKNAWWFKRNTEHQRSGAQDKIDIAKYDAYYLGKDEKVIYLTFDCGYENGFTPQILDTLKKHNAKAIFFVTKTFIRDNIDLVKRMKEEGHFVGNHTCSHPSMPTKSSQDVIKEITECATYMKEQTGYEMDPYIRPPMGEYSERTLKISQDLGYKTIFWSIAYLDYDVNNQPGKDYVVEHFKKYYHNGAVPLIHNVSKSNTEALDEVLTFLEQQGYRFPNVDEL